MHNDLPDHYAMVFIKRVWALGLLVPLSVVLLVGCVGEKFHGDFSSMEVQPPEPLHPLVGAWEGSWQSAAQGGNHIARAVIAVNSAERYEIQLELSDFEREPGVSNFPFDKYWIELRDMPVAHASNAAEQFQTKTRLKKADRSTLIAEAMTLDGNIGDDSLQIQFSTNDALNELDHGRIDLHRIVAQRPSSIHQKEQQ